MAAISLAQRWRVSADQGALKSGAKREREEGRSRSEGATDQYSYCYDRVGEERMAGFHLLLLRTSSQDNLSLTGDHEGPQKKSLIYYTHNFIPPGPTIPISSVTFAPRSFNFCRNTQLPILPSQNRQIALRKEASRELPGARAEQSSDAN